MGVDKGMVCRGVHPPLGGGRPVGGGGGASVVPGGLWTRGGVVQQRQVYKQLRWMAVGGERLKHMDVGGADMYGAAFPWCVGTCGYIAMEENHEVVLLCGAWRQQHRSEYCQSGGRNPEVQGKWAKRNK